MHTASGLIDEIPDGGTLADAEAAGPGLRARARARAGKAPLCGLERLRRPRLPRARHARRWTGTCTTGSSTSPRSRSWPAAGTRGSYFNAPAKNGNHRALADIRESIAELRYYREAHLRAARPDPDSATATGDRRQPRRSRRVRLTPARTWTGVRGTLSAAGPCIAVPRPHGGCSSAGRAPGCGPGGRGFKSRHSPQEVGALARPTQGYVRVGGLGTRAAGRSARAGRRRRSAQVPLSAEQDHGRTAVGPEHVTALGRGDAARTPANVAAPLGPDETPSASRSATARSASSSFTATAASQPLRSTGQAATDTVPQLSPAITVAPVGTSSGRPASRLASRQAAVSGSTDSTPGCGAPGRR